MKASIICDYHDEKKVFVDQCKYFMIGHGRTGFRSICQAMVDVGVQVKGGLEMKCHAYLKDMLMKIMEGRTDLDLYRGCECAAVHSYIHWKLLARNRPEARFILSVRPIDNWIHSWKRRRTSHKIQIRNGLTSVKKQGAMGWNVINRLMTYGMLSFDKEIWRNLYVDHNRKVLDYFKGSDRLLVLNVWEMSDKELWGRLGGFVRRPFVVKPFPHLKQGDKINYET